MKRIYIAKDPHGKFLLAYSSLDCAKRGFATTFSKVAGTLLFDDSRPEWLLVTDPNGAKYTVEPEWIYDNGEHL